MTKKKPVKRKPTKADKVRHFLRTHPEGTRNEFHAWSSMTISSSQFSTIRNNLFKEQHVKKASTKVNKVLRFAELEEENKFLRGYSDWLLSGVREGYLDYFSKNYSS